VIRVLRNLSVLGVIALLVLLPETLAAARSARRNRIQISLNLAFGSAMASIGLTIPAIAVASIWLEGPLILGLDATQMAALRAAAERGAGRPGSSSWPRRRSRAATPSRPTCATCSAPTRSAPSTAGSRGRP
jgi:hypothetical protein